jgi:DNA-binding CsgD family transcriptional regulator
MTDQLRSKLPHAIHAMKEDAMSDVRSNYAIFNAVRKLTLHQRRILVLLTLGHQNKVIGAALGITENAIKAQMTTILEVLCCDNRTQAALVGFCLLNRINAEEIVGRRRRLTENQVPTDEQLGYRFRKDVLLGDERQSPAYKIAKIW